MLLEAWPTAAWAEVPQAEQYFLEGYKYQSGEEGVQNLNTALKYYKKALELDPELYQARFNKALIYYMREEYQAAYSEFRKVGNAVGTDNAPMASQVRNMMGICSQKMDKNGRAKKLFEDAIKLDPSQIEPHYNLINLLVGEESFEKARKRLEIAEVYAPTPRYEKFKGKIRGLESRAEWESKEIKIAILGLAVVLTLYWAYKKFTA